MQTWPMKTWPKTTQCFCTTLLAVIFVCAGCFAQIRAQNSSSNWANSPRNWRNSPDNWQNSSQNWANSPQNWKNSPDNWQNNGNNFNSTNGIYDSSGNRIGYGVPTANGGVNYFNNDGTRRAFQPGQ